MTKKCNLSIVIMAAGKGTRMNSEIPKVLHELSNKTLISHVIDTARQLNPEKIIVIIGHEAEMVRQSIDASDILFSYQLEQKGTGHAIMQTEEHLKDFKGQTLVLSGDVPMIKKSTLSSLIDKQTENNFDASMLTSELVDPSGYGRVIKDYHGNLKEVREHKDCNDQELLIKEINSGIYVFKNQTLFNLLPKLKNQNAQSEYYLPDVLPMIVALGGNIGLEKSNNFTEIQGVNTLEQLNELEELNEKSN